MKFSIIVPTYNSEAYIKELMNSLVKQTLNKQDFEVIVVDDCSTDNTLKLVESYKKKLNLIIDQLDQNSGGPGKPRNTAFDLAQGEYVFFVDSDDYIHKDTLLDVSKFVNQNNADVVLVRMEGVNGRGVPKSMFQETRDEVTLLDSRIIYTLSPTKFYRTSLLRNNNIYFPEELKSAEDQLFTMKAYINAQKIAVLADKSYYYATKREGEHMSSAYVAPNEFYQVMSLIVDEILQRNLEHTNEILAKFIDRHFSFSRTKNFSLNIKAEQQQQWIEALGDFILRVPKEVDALVNAAIRPLLYYARQKDFDHYQIVEESYRNGHYYNFKANQNLLQIQFAQHEPFFDFENVTKPDIKMTQFNFDDQQFSLELTFLKSMINPNQIANQLQLKLVSRNKKEIVYVPLTVNNQTNFKFTTQLNDVVPYLLKEKVWDAFLEMRIGNMTIDKRIGNKRNKYPCAKETSTIVQQNGKYYRFTPYFTKDFDNLSFYLTENELTNMLKVTTKGKLTVTIEPIEFNYILSTGMASLLYQDSFVTGYLSQKPTKNSWTYELATTDKLKASVLKKDFVIATPSLKLEFDN